MIALLRGLLLDKQPNRVIVNVAGVGYDVHVPLSTFYELGEVGTDTTLRIYTHVREEAFQLYGFLTELERQLFEQLISVSGIGPKVAIAVLSGMETRELVSAVERADVVRLTRIPGVGKKTAERIVLELKDRLTRLAVPASEQSTPAGSAGDKLRGDLLSALQNLGYHRAQAERAIDAVLAADAESGFEQALRGALRELVGSRQ
jgi:Holliday junction DNA helicase RuvA